MLLWRLLGLAVSIALLWMCQSDGPPAVRTMEAPPFDPARRHDGDFKPGGSLEQLSESLFVYDDSCLVYIVRDGSRATLVGFGTGDVLDVLPEIGVTEVERVLLTHHHRNQVQGLVGMDSGSFQVTVPAGEAAHFENVENFWQDAQIYVNYNLRSEWNTIRKSIPVDEKVAGGDTLVSSGVEFHVLETPAVTENAVSYSAEIDGRRVVFTGDLIAGAGKVHNWFDLHWDYYGFTQGIDASEQSFDRVLAVNPERLLPAHGAPIEEPGVAIAANREVYDKLRKLLPPNSAGREIGERREITPHLVHLGGPPTRRNGYLTSYAIVSDNGKALIYDYGYVDLEHLQEFKQDYGIEDIAVTFSHYHDDHLIRLHELLRTGGAEIWVFENMVDILANPTRYRLPCLIPFPIIADRVLHDGETVQWEEYELEFFHMPGQTDFHQGLATVVDGKKVMFTGDNTWKKEDPERIRNGPIVPHNEYFLDTGFITCARRMLDYMPDLVLPAHTDEYSPTRQDLEGFLTWAQDVREVMTDLILQPDPNFGMDYRWAHFYPVRQVTDGRREFVVELVMRNHLFTPGDVNVSLQLPPEVECRHRNRSVRMEPKSQVAVPFRLRRVDGESGRLVVTADLTFNGRRLGEVTEMLVE